MERREAPRVSKEMRTTLRRLRLSALRSLGFFPGAKDKATAYPAPQRIRVLALARLRRRLRRAAFAGNGLPAETPKAFLFDIRIRD